MTNRHKDFTTGPKIKDLVTFTIDSQEFSARPAIPGAILLEFVSRADSDSPTDSAEALLDFFDLVLVDEDRERFSGYIRDPDRAIQIETLAEIVEFLVSVYTDRPTIPPSRSVSTRSRKKVGSAAGSLKAVEPV